LKFEEESEDDANIGEETQTSEPVSNKTLGDDEEDKLDLDPNAIDAYWLQRELTNYYEDAIQSQKMEGEVLEILQKTTRIGDLENKLVQLLGYLCFDFVKILVQNRLKILYCTKLGKAQTAEEREKLELLEMNKDPEASAILKILKGKAPSKSTTLPGRVEKEARESRRSQRAHEKLERVAMEVLEDQDAGIPISEYIDLESLAFQQEGHLMSNKQCKLPQGTLKRSKKRL